LIDADGEDIFFLNGDPFLGQSQVGVGEIDNKAWWRIESLNLRNDGTGGEDFNRRYATLMHDANAGHHRRRTKGLRCAASSEQRGDYGHTHTFERRLRQRTPHWGLEETYHLRWIGEKGIENGTESQVNPLSS